ncbi:MAG: hypothetical protein HRF50_13770 [Phycisphaerae bacterium]|jgi:hypothetical protein
MVFPRRLAAMTAALMVSSAFGWGSHGHRVITMLALDGLPPDAPAWLRDAEIRKRIAFQSNEPDRWRGWRAPALGHANNPDHYLDMELLAQFGLTLESVPPLRYEYLRTLAIAKHEHPENVDPYDAAKDAERAKEWPGFALHAMQEHYVKLQSCFHQIRIIEQLNEPRRAFQLTQLRENAVYHMGMLSHFVGDIGQPLHTTKHFNGWVGENPAGYTTSTRFHPYIDSGVLEKHGLTYESVKPAVTYSVTVNAADPWDDLLAYFRGSFERVEPLYQLERDGLLDQDAGRAFIVRCLADASAMLSALYWGAYASSAPTAEQVATWVRYDGIDAPPPAAATAPHPSSAPARGAAAGSPPEP